MKKYKINLQVRVINFVMQSFVRLGLGPRHTYLLTVQGRKSGRSYSTPVTLVENQSGRWLVAPYGEVNWVRNARATGQVILARGMSSEKVSIAEVEPEEGAHVLQKYIVLEPITRPYFNAKVGSPWEVFQAETARHPVFRLTKLA